MNPATQSIIVEKRNVFMPFLKQLVRKWIQQTGPDFEHASSISRDNNHPDSHIRKKSQ